VNTFSAVPRPGTDITFATPSGTAQQLVSTCRLRPSRARWASLSRVSSEATSCTSWAQNSGEYGTLIGKITVDDVVVSRNESLEAYSIATCQGRA
jgi:hypothetical protein